MTRRALPRANVDKDRRGTTVIEFAIIAPLMLLTVMGLMELGYQAYVTSILQGALNKAGRDSTLEDGTLRASAIDAQVHAAVREVSQNATFTQTRVSYSTFSHVNGLEDFIDKKQDDVYDGLYDSTKECFIDLNNNGVRDAVVGQAGNGGADDIVKYSMTVRYPLLFPLNRMIGWPSFRNVTATTIMRNQPFGAQEKRGVEVCPPPAS